MIKAPAHGMPDGMPLRYMRFCLVAMMLIICGCTMVGPDFSRPRAPVARQWRETNDPVVDSSRREDFQWWTVFHDPVLVRLIEVAYRQNLTLRVAGLRVLRARAQLAVAIGGLYPQQQQISTALSYTRLPLELPYVYETVPNYWTTSFMLQEGWEIDFWGQLRRAVQYADDVFLGSVANYDAALVTLIGDVASDYVQIRTLQKRIDIARANVEKQRQSLQIAEAKFHGGTATELDVDQAKNVLGATEATIPALRMRLAETENALAVLLGIPPQPLDKLLAGSSDIPTAPASVAVGIPADLLERRPDVRKAELDAAAQCAQIGVAKAYLYPILSIGGSIGTLTTTLGASGLDALFTGGSLLYSVGPTIQWNFLNFGRLDNNVRVQDARFEELLVVYQNTVLAAQQEVENGIATFTQSREQAKFLRDSVDAAQRALEIAMLQYTEGTADFTTVLTAEQNLLVAQDNLATATGTIALGLIQTYRALGGGWQIRQGGDFVPEPTRAEMARRTNWGDLLTPVDMLRPEAPGLPSSQDTGPLVRPPEW